MNTPNAMSTVNRICFSVCMFCILFGTATSILMIWTPGIDEIKWRLLTTDGVIFLASLSTLAVTKIHGGENRTDGLPLRS